MTVEAKAAEADRVVLGRVQSIIPLNPPNDFRTVVVDVARTLKGPSCRTILFEAVVYKNDPFWSSGHDSMFFLLSGVKLSRSGWSTAQFSLVLDERPGTNPVDLNFPADALSANQCSTWTRDQLIELVSVHCTSPTPIPIESIAGLPWPNWNFEGASRPGILEVPVDSPMELSARQWAGSTDALIRWNATRLLRHTKSSENIAALQTIAAHPVDSEQACVAQALAVNTLDRWGIRESPAGGRRPVASFTLAACEFIIPALLLTAGYELKFRQRISRSHRLFPCWNTVLVFATSLLASAWVISYFGGIGFRNGHSEAGVWHGTIVLVERTHAEITGREPGRFVDAGSLWAVRQCAETNYGVGPHLWWFVGARGEAGDSIYPYWTTLHGLAIPIWQPVAGLLATLAMISGVGAARRSLQNRRAGFPVLVPSGVSSSVGP